MNECYFDSEDEKVVDKLSEHIYQLIHKIDKDYKDIVVLCIGTDRSTGDSLAPLVGYKLNINEYNSTFIYGDIYNPIHAQNLNETISMIYQKHNKPLIIAIDASLGRYDHVGYIKAGYGEIQAGAGLGKNLNPVGDIFIIGIVNIGGFMEFEMLQSTRLSFVFKISDIIAISLNEALIRIKEKQYKIV